MSQEKTKTINFKITPDEDIYKVLIAQKNITKTIKSLLKQYFYKYGNVDYFDSLIKNESERPDIVTPELLEEAHRKASETQKRKEVTASKENVEEQKIEVLPDENRDVNDVSDTSKLKSESETQPQIKDVNDFSSIFNASRQKSESMEKRKHSDINLYIFG